MNTLTDTINAKLNHLNLDIEEFLYTELLFITNQLKYDFKNHSLNNLSNYIEILNEIKTLKQNTLSYTNSPVESNPSDLLNDIENAIATSGNVYTKPNQDDSYYFYNFNPNYGETDKNLNLIYKLINIEDFDLFPLKISGLKLFDNVFLGQTFRDSMKKLFSFLFMLNEQPFIELCSEKSKYFSNSASDMNKPIVLKENECYFESNIDEDEAIEMIKTFLNYINIDLSACKVLTQCSTNKSDENYITIVL
ncbi:hypothetical protein [Candidatus Arthromitus sp. SFB-rat-Yit]|uniref:hypothetical protein n=1 Tax=Candidatus Arthromitus sp. SFB-rat-Yit TaxID=1041504 RepID=UPI000227A39A|nr:hypothetical protein [Candidatus Arthromitus sp. SFB-rat-Yit]BAK81495.1 hypothetical protein RATSFB_0933 [Candidatus Arthromitus sp. SFB-rat-Yit]